MFDSQSEEYNITEELREWTPIAGVSQGDILSPVLSNVYLNPLDHQMAAHGFEMVRYADDFIVLGRSASEAAEALERITAWVASAGLTLHPTTTKIVDSRVESFAFLGYSFRGDQFNTGQLFAAGNEWLDPGAFEFAGFRGVGMKAR